MGRIKEFFEQLREDDEVIEIQDEEIEYLLDLLHKQGHCCQCGKHHHPQRVATKMILTQSTPRKRSDNIG